jgi:hypothetical protein
VLISLLVMFAGELDLVKEPISVLDSFFVGCWSYSSLSVVLLWVCGCHVRHLVEFSHSVDVISATDEPPSDMSLYLGGTIVATPKYIPHPGTSNPRLDFCGST